jgi:hypothetical protein
MFVAHSARVEENMPQWKKHKYIIMNTLQDG